MTAEESVNALIPLVTQMSGHIVEMKGELGDVKAEIAEVKTTGEATLVQATKTNGRMTTAETNISALQKRLAIDEHDEARDEREAEVVETRRQTRVNVKVALGAAVLGAGVIEGLQALLHVLNLA